MLARQFLTRTPTSLATRSASLLSSQGARRQLSFSFAGPKALDDIIKKDLLESKTGAEIADIWYSYHETRVSECVREKDGEKKKQTVCSQVKFYSTTSRKMSTD